MDFPVPKPDESLERYTIRCASVAKGMDPDEFNEAVWENWHKYRGPTDEEKVAKRSFSPDRYTHVPGVCVFAEHKTTTSSGKKKKYSLKDLVKIVRGNNDRISDVNAFPAISDGHTSNPGDPNHREPKILGYAGNYRLGRIGRKRPRWAIFQDEYHLKEAEPVLREKPRRSVELWTFQDGRAHFDPVAAIGAEAPRLPLPQRFHTFEYEGAKVERYTFQSGAFASPGAMSTYVPKFKSGPPTPSPRTPTEEFQPDTYSAEPDGEALPPDEGDNDMPRLAPEDLAEIVAAIAETPQFKWITEKMEEEQRQGAPGADDLESDEDDISDLTDILGPNEEEEEPPIDEPPLDLDNEEETAEPEEKTAMAYSQENDQTAVVEKYTKLANSHQNLMKDFGRAQERIQQLERRNADLDRRRRLEGLAERFPTIDVDEESKATLYSLGATVSDEEFDKHIATIEKYAEKFAKAQVYIPGGDAPKTENDPEKYAMAQKVNQMAVKIHAEKLAKGEQVSYDEARDLAKQRLSNG